MASDFDLDQQLATTEQKDAVNQWIHKLEAQLVEIIWDLPPDESVREATQDAADTLTDVVVWMNRRGFRLTYGELATIDVSIRSNYAHVTEVKGRYL